MSRQVYRGVVIENVGLSWYVHLPNLSTCPRWFGSRAAARTFVREQVKP